MSAFFAWAAGKGQAPAIDAEATGSRAEKADTETIRPASILPRRGEGIKTMEAKELIRRYSAGERDFAGSDLRGAHLYWANLREADLSGARATQVQLDQVKSLEGAVLPDGTKYTSQAESEPVPPELTNPKAEEQPNQPADLDASDNDREVAE